ncbi:hypothetical protein IMZ11_24460 [Microtetraspora sp. AC03309]|uniref:hypothetical protein n=1 Tax=Microtetraspora sp. AC03309 TaxID=2779376 RepID=UPI001E490EF0|nr:hypothetical protein [Microtetraspora sp. AC03309]MCC5578785.1 hypothetical protein [Microtetraspora sp. AC03309]
MIVPAAHVAWTGPHRAGLRRHRDRALEDGPYGLPVEEILTSVHSVRAWRAFHGGVELITDELGAAYAAGQGLDALYDRVDTALDGLDTLDVDPLLYFAAGKSYAATLRAAPFAIVDTDLYLRRPLSGLARGGFVFAHWESTGNAVYPPVDEVPNQAGADLSRWIFDTPAANMAVSVFLDDVHRATYAEAAMAFMTGNAGPSETDPIVRQTFAEQRLAPAVARALGIDPRPVTGRFWVVEAESWDGPSYAALFHHTWNQKRWLRQFPELRPAYWRYLLEDLLWRFPDTYDLLLSIPALKECAELVRRTRSDLDAHGPTVIDKEGE